MMTPHANVRTAALIDFVRETVVKSRFAFEVSPVHADGTVVVRFRSTAEMASVELADAFEQACLGTNRRFTRTDDNKVRLVLDQFWSDEHHAAQKLQQAV